MHDLNNVVGINNLTVKYGTIHQHCYLKDQELILCKCDSALIFVSLSGAIINSVPVEQTEMIVATHKDDTGWQILLKNDDRLSLIRNTSLGAIRIHFTEPGANANSAAWSPCGRYIAVGHEHDTSVSVWCTESASQVWKRSATWDMDGQCLYRPSLTVSGWSEDGRYIVTAAEYLISYSIIIWNAVSGEMATLIK